jgi:hypothetical protein
MIDLRGLDQFDVLERILVEVQAGSDAALKELLDSHQPKREVVQAAMTDEAVSLKEATVLNNEVLAAMQAVPGLQFVTNEWVLLRDERHHLRRAYFP